MYLNTHSYYSLRYGTFCPKTLIELSLNNGFRSIALTDINSTSACLEFIREAQRREIKPVVGVDFRQGSEQRFVMLAKNNDGFEQINIFLSEILHKKNTLKDRAPELPNTFIIYPFERNKKFPLLRANEYIGVRPSDIDYLRIKKISPKKCVILQTVSFRHKRDFNTHRLLRAIDLNTLLSKLPLHEQGDQNQVMYPRNILLELYADFPEIIYNTDKLLGDCQIHFDFSDRAEPQNQRNYTGDEEEDIALLYQLCEEGLNYRYPKITEEIQQRIESELSTIIEMGFVSYFLINWDIVNYARSNGYFYVGRGSGANSVIAYILRITDVDPIELDLYFERFINLYRKNPPDFDIDFSWKDREDITRYIFERFPHVALVATYNTFQQRGVIRELGKVFGLPKEEIDLLSKGRMPPDNEVADLVIKYGSYIHGMPSTLSVHACGILISERPIEYFSATFMPPKGYRTIQFDMHVAEDVGLFKFDILSQRGLSKIKDTLDIIAYNQADKADIDIHAIHQFKEDERIRSMLCHADSIGCFYVESPAMRMLMSKLRVTDYLGLVAASSVIRPGVSQSGMMQEYIRRSREPERRKDAHPVLLDLMPETYGVMVYQEDVIKVAHYFAGLSLAEADKMRRGMSGKFRSREEFQAVKAQFFENCQKKGHDPELSAEIWRQTESFAGYAFAKGHSASYAVESYQCLFLKAYFPLEFMVATINNYGGFYRTEVYVQEARKHGGQILPPCVNHSHFDTVIYGKDIYLGYHLLHSFETVSAKRIVNERINEGPFSNLDDFIDRIQLSLEQLTLLIRIDAFRFTGKSKRSLLWEAHLKCAPTKHQTGNPALFSIERKQFAIPAFASSTQENAFDEMELLGFPLNNPFQLSTNTDSEKKIIQACDFQQFIGKQIWTEGYYVHAKKTPTSRHETMYFGTFLDENGDWIDTVHFPDAAARYPFRGPGVYRIYGKVVVEYDFLSIEVLEMHKQAVIEDPRYAEAKTQKVIETNNSRKGNWSRSNKDAVKSKIIQL
jgi:DNA-directed DNA polymerase III PolC